MTLLTEADTCRKFVLPRLYSAGWTDDQISEQKSFTDGRIVVVGKTAKRRPQKRADYLLRYRRDYAIAVVPIEAKASRDVMRIGKWMCGNEVVEFFKNFQIATSLRCEGVERFW
ncbi:MAG: hypothetical protein ABSD20_21240 [Terriglobales bacterium]|jgi:type I site-specific restriction endonuclease